LLVHERRNGAFDVGSTFWILWEEEKMVAEEEAKLIDPETQ
jgi:hypothetical protein